jgi:hypothetical protein
LFSSSCSACCVSEGCLEARGDDGVPRICSAKLPRCERGSGLPAILSAGGGGERPRDAVELLRDWIGVGMWPSFLFASCSAMVEGAMRGGGGQVCFAGREWWGDVCDHGVRSCARRWTIRACYVQCSATTDRLKR